MCSLPFNFNWSFPTLLEISIEVERNLPCPLAYYWILVEKNCFSAKAEPNLGTSTNSSPTKGHGKSIIVCSSKFELAYYSAISDVHPVLLDISNFILLRDFLLANLSERVIVTDIAFSLKTPQAVQEFYWVYGEISGLIKNTIFVLRSDLLGPSYTFALRRLFPTHLLFTAHLQDGKLLMFYQQLYKGYLKSEKLTLNVEEASMLPFKMPQLGNRNNATPKPISSFALTSTSEQKMQQAGVELPYLKAQTLIEYIPDEADDIDEEDPDADLEF